MLISDIQFLRLFISRAEGGAVINLNGLGGLDTARFTVEVKTICGLDMKRDECFSFQI